MKTISTLKKLAALALIINFYTANAHIYKVINETHEVVQIHVNLASCLINPNVDLTLQPGATDQIDTGYCCVVDVNIKKGSEEKVYIPNNSIIRVACWGKTIHVIYKKDGSGALDYSTE
jgi:hypothetical protein